MRWLIWYIRSVFCDHVWLHEEAVYEIVGTDEVSYRSPVVSVTCTKCAWQRSYIKFRS